MTTSDWAASVAKTILANAHLHNHSPGVVNLAKDRDAAKQSETAAWAAHDIWKLKAKGLESERRQICEGIAIIGDGDAGPIAYPDIGKLLPYLKVMTDCASRYVSAVADTHEMMVERDAAQGQLAEALETNKWLDVDIGLVLAKLEVVPNLREEIDAQEARADRLQNELEHCRTNAGEDSCADILIRNAELRARAEKAEALAEQWKADEAITRELLEDEIAKLRGALEESRRQLAEIQAPGNALADHLLGVRGTPDKGVK